MSDRQWPVSVKGVIVADGHVLLLENDRDEWELPGGRLEAGESPEPCLLREVAEETGLQVEADRILDCWVYPVLPDRRVLIVTYGCRALDRIPILTISREHRDARFVHPTSCNDSAMPDGYRRSISAWAQRRPGHEVEPGGHSLLSR